MSNSRESVSIGDEVPRKSHMNDGGPLNTVVHYDGRFGTTQCQYDSGYRFSFDNDNAFLDAVAEEVEEIARFEARAWPYHNDGKERGGWRSVYLKEEEVS